MEYFPAEALDGVEGAPNPSAVVQGWVGTSGVCEPAALLASDMGALLVPKTKTRNVTVAVARMRFSDSAWRRARHRASPPGCHCAGGRAERPALRIGFIGCAAYGN